MFSKHAAKLSFYRMLKTRTSCSIFKFYCMKFHSSCSEYFVKSKKPQHAAVQHCRIRGLQKDFPFSWIMNPGYILWISESLRYLILTEGVTWVWASQKIAVISGDKIWNSEWASGNVTSLASLLVWYLWYLHLQTRLRSSNKHCRCSFELLRLASHKKATALMQASWELLESDMHAASLKLIKS